jgi:hypothetical protein
MGDLGPAKDIIRDLPPGIRLETTQSFAERLTTEQDAAARAAIAAAVEELKALQPPLDIEDANQLVSWQEARESGRPVTP